eukprot:4543679-Prymnesium_polylepis.1
MSPAARGSTRRRRSAACVSREARRMRDVPQQRARAGKRPPRELTSQNDAFVHHVSEPLKRNEASH